MLIKIGDSKINIYEHDIVYNNTKDRKLFDDISKAWLERHVGWEKSENAIMHDLIITKLCQKFASDKKIFALTLDISLETLSLSWIGDKEDPIWRSLYSLVQVLAINGGGPDFNPNDLAPLVKIFIEQEDLSRSDNYDKRDLLMLTDLSDRIKELSDTKIISLLNKIHIARMSGNKDQQAFKDVKLELERSLIKQSHELNEVISEKDEKINSLEDKLNISEQRNANHERKMQWFWFSVKTIASFILSFLLFMILGSALIKKLQLEGWTYDVIKIILFIISPMYYIVCNFIKVKSNKK